MPELELTPEQEKKLLERWNQTPDSPPSFAELSVAIFGKEFDGRTFEGKAIKQSLAKYNIKVRSGHNYYAKSDDIELSEAHQLYITNNAKTMTAVEMARIIFANPNLTNLHIETRAVNNFMKGLDSKVIFSPDSVGDVPTSEYKPPKTTEQALKRVNQYVSYIVDKDKLNAQQKKQIEMVISYLHTFRFTQQMNNYDSEGDRKLCEDSFVRGIYDKPDLAQEEIDQYIELANQVVLGFKIQRRSEKLQAAMESISGNDPETMKISMGLTEAIGKASTEYHQCIARQEKLLSNLTQKRSSRLDKQIRNNASILNLVQEWKNEELRAEYIAIGELEQKAVTLEVDRLSTLPEIKARLLGLPKDEIRYG